MTSLRWTTKSVRTLAAELTAAGHRVGPDTVAGLLHAAGFSLQGNAKVLEGRTEPDRDAQFRYIQGQVAAHQDGGEPVVSVDSKKKERVGPYANPGRTWRPAGDPVEVRSHDFPDPQTATAIPYGIYDLAADTGWVNVGTDHNTATFAVASIRRWWDGAGRRDYPDATRLLITADAGGSNGYRTRAWKGELAALAADTALAITVCHFPPGTSKWNKIEHRLFSHITMNWRGRPLTSHHVVVESIAATTTRTGLRVHAELDPATYDLGLTLTDTALAALPLRRHPWHGDWNYTLTPAPPQAPAPPEAPQPPGARPATDPAPTPPPDPTWLTHPALSGIPTDHWPALVTIMTALEGERPRSTRGAPTPLSLTARLTATLVNHHTRLPLRELAPLYGVHPVTLATYTKRLRAHLDQTHQLPRRGPLHLATLDDLYAVAAYHDIPHPPRKHTC